MRSVWRHSRAARIEVSVQADGGGRGGDAADDGVGFDPGAVLFESGIAVMRSFAVLGQAPWPSTAHRGWGAGDGEARGRRRCADAPGGPGPGDPGGEEVAGAGRGKPSRACGCWWAAAARRAQSVKREVAYSQVTRHAVSAST